MRAVLLDRAAAKLRAAIVDVRAPEQVMHDVEWVASGDHSMDILMVPLPSAVEDDR